MNNSNFLIQEGNQSVSKGLYFFFISIILVSNTDIKFMCPEKTGVCVRVRVHVRVRVRVRVCVCVCVCARYFFQ